jgi:hypothetical protein
MPSFAMHKSFVLWCSQSTSGGHASALILLTLSNSAGHRRPWSAPYVDFMIQYLGKLMKRSPSEDSKSVSLHLLHACSHTQAEDFPLLWVLIGCRFPLLHERRQGDYCIRGQRLTPGSSICRVLHRGCSSGPKLHFIQGSGFTPK